MCHGDNLEISRSCLFGGRTGPSQAQEYDQEYGKTPGVVNFYRDQEKPGRDVRILVRVATTFQNPRNLYIARVFVRGTRTGQRRKIPKAARRSTCHSLVPLFSRTNRIMPYRCTVLTIRANITPPDQLRSWWSTLDRTYTWMLVISQTQSPRMLLRDYEYGLSRSRNPYPVTPINNCVAAGSVSSTDVEHNRQPADALWEGTKA